MQEKLIEDDGVKYAKDRDWLVYKWTSPGHSGILDRLFFKKSVSFAIEYKTTGEKASAKQREEAIKLRRAQIPCRCIDNVQDSRAFIDEMTRVADEKDPIFDMIMLSNDITSFGG